MHYGIKFKKQEILWSELEHHWGHIQGRHTQRETEKAPEPC